MMEGLNADSAKRFCSSPSQPDELWSLLSLPLNGCGG